MVSGVLFCKGLGFLDVVFQLLPIGESPKKESTIQAICGVINSGNAVVGACNVIMLLEAFLGLIFGKADPGTEEEVCLLVGFGNDVEFHCIKILIV